MENIQILLVLQYLVLNLNLHQSNIHIWSKLLEDNADILAAFLSKSYCGSFCLIFLFKILIRSVTVTFYRVANKFFLNLKGLLDDNIVSIVKKEYGSLVYSL